MICSGCEVWKENAELKTELVRLQVENGKLKRQLALYQSIAPPVSRRKRRSLKPAASGKRFTGRPKGYPGTTRPVPDPDIVVAPEWDACENCGAPLPPPEDVDHNIVEDVPNPSPRTATDFLKFGGRCVRCGTYNVARHPDCPPNGRFGKNVYVQATLHKFEERLPLEKIASAFERDGLEVSAPTVLELLWRTSNWLRPEYERMLASVRASRVVYTDQTGIKVDGANFHIWDFVTDSETFFMIKNNKSQKVLEEVLRKDWRGTLVGDGLSSHHTFVKKSGAKIQRDWAHLLTEVEELGEDYEEARGLSEGLHRLFDRLKKALENDPPPEERVRLDRNAKRTMRRLIGRRPKHTKVRKFVEKIKRAFPYWFTFVTSPGVEPTNNRAERALRELVVQRKIVGTLRNEKGMRMYETLPTLLATWKQRGINPREALSTALAEAWQTVTKSTGQ